MTISTSQSTETFIGNGVTNTFDFTFVGDSAAFITVSYQDEDGNINILSPTQYTLFLNPPAVGALWGVGGTVTYPITGSPIVDNTFLIVGRTLPLTQVISMSNQGNFFPQVTEEALDTLEMQIQQIASRTGIYRGIWVTDTIYNLGDLVIDGANGNDTGNYYVCVIPNTSGVWNTDLVAGDWNLVLDVSILGPVSNVTGTPDRITVTNGSTTPHIDIALTYVGQASITTLGTIATGVWNATTIGASKGGTGLTSITAHNLLIGNGTSAATLLAPSATSGVALVSQGPSADPAYGTIAIAGGGTGQTSYTDGQLLIGNSSGNTLTKATLTAGTNVSITNGNGSIAISASALGTGIANAGVNFNGTGTIAIRKSFNISSLDDNGTGSYAINFTSALSANYLAIATGNQSIDVALQTSQTVVSPNVATPTTSKYSLSSGNTEVDTATDFEFVNAIFFNM